MFFEKRKKRKEQSSLCMMMIFYMKKVKKQNNTKMAGRYSFTRRTLSFQLDQKMFLYDIKFKAATTTTPRGHKCDRTHGKFEEQKKLNISNDE